MGELDEFAEALLAQLSIEINEEKEIADLSEKIAEDPSFEIKFPELEEVCEQIFPQTAKKIQDFIGIPIFPTLKLKYSTLDEFKKLKGKKVFSKEDGRSYVDELFDAVAKQNLEKIVELIKKDTTKFLVYSTYAKAYLSKISTTYGDYLDSTIYLNKFILSSYPQIVLYKQGKPYETRFDIVQSGFYGALKMTILD